MTELASYSEEECFNVYWKIKNFSYCCEKIESAEFYLSGELCCLRLDLKYLDIKCALWRFCYNANFNPTIQISFLTCDDSAEESASGNQYVELKIPKDVIFGKRRNDFLPEDTLTVRLRCLTDTERGKVFIYSIIGVKRRYFLCPFKDFSKFKSNATRSVERAESYGHIDLNCKSMGGNNPTEQFRIEISRISGERCYCVLKMHILDVDGKAVNEVSDEFFLDQKDNQQTRCFPFIIKKRKLLANENLLLPNDTLTLKCEFAISLGKVTDQTANYCEDVTPLLKEFDAHSILFKEKIDPGSVTELQTHLKSMLDDGTLFDVNLQIGSELIRAHKTILSARSPVFRAMFSKDMKEAMNGTVVIEDLDLESVRGLLLYLYTDTINDYQWESVKKLYFASDKYEVLSLKKKCVSFLKSNFSISNVCDALVLADLHQDGDLKTATIDFISECDSEVFASEAWEELEKNNSPLAFKVMREINRNLRIRLN